MLCYVFFYFMLWLFFTYFDAAAIEKNTVLSGFIVKNYFKICNNLLYTIYLILFNLLYTIVYY